MAEIINLNHFRKSNQKADKETQAAQNRVRHGRRKDDRQRQDRDDERQRQDLDGRLIGGAVIFGAGWGLSGFCPGPAIASLAFLRPEIGIFVVAMVVGSYLARLDIFADRASGQSTRSSA